MEPIMGKFGEKKLLFRIQKYLGKSRSIVRTFSEDCAVLDPGGANFELFTVDTLIDGIHFKSEYMPPFFIGRKVVKVNVSDISAMGGKPEHCLVSLGLPAETPVRFVEKIYQGMDSAFREAGIQLIGGNLSSSPVLFLDLFLTGLVPKKQAVFRNGAGIGDFIFVTGELGASAEGLRLLKNGFRLSTSRKRVRSISGLSDSRFVLDAILTHFDPPSQNALARKLASWKMLSSMIDLSDGLSSDLREICRESGTGAVIDISKIPISPAVLYWESKRTTDPLQLALCGGEDYHLLFTIPKDIRQRFLMRARKEKIKVFEVGRVQERKEGIHLITGTGKRIPFPPGFEHFHEHRTERATKRRKTGRVVPQLS
jgi:thiamine-monophosphate kinase